MTDIRAGSIIRDLGSSSMDWPDSVASYDNTTIANITTTTFGAGSPLVELLFEAGTTGRALITISTSSRDNSAGAARVISTFELYLGTSSAGTSIISSSSSTLEYEVTSAGQALGFQYVSRTALVTGLTPGSTYYARHMYKASASGGSDVAMRELIVRPAS